MINTNYYTIKINQLLKKQYIFVSIVSLSLILLVHKIINQVLSMDTFIYTLKFQNKKFYTINLTQQVMSNIKIVYYVVGVIAIIAFVNSFYERFLYVAFSKERRVKWYDVKSIKYPFKSDELKLILGLVYNESNTELALNPKYESITGDGLMQNILITGTIGTGKTSSAITPIAVQLIYLYFNQVKDKAAMLFLDVKGNFYKFVHAFAYECGRWDDVITIELGGKWKYNPLHKPNLSEIELANRMRYILELFASAHNDTYWIDKAEDTITEILKIIRLYNHGYVNFEELHRMGINDEYREQRIQELEMAAENGELNEDQKYKLYTAISYFENEFAILPIKAQAFIKSEITRMTQPFISTKTVRDTFCPSRHEINFYGFEDVINEGKIVVWKINANKEPKVAKLIAAYLKLDYQKEIMISLENKKSNPTAANRIKVTLCDEYHEYCTKNDAEFLSQSREPRAITIAATQSYTSIKKALHNDETMTNMLLQSFVNKIWLRSDDIEYTVQKVMKQIAKVETEKVSRSITESSRNSKVNYSLGRVLGKGKNLSSGTSITTQKEYKFDEHFLVQQLKTGQAVCFISNGDEIKPPKVVHLTKLHEGRILYENGKFVFTTDKNKIFKYIGKVDIDELENETVKGLDEKELINSERVLANIGPVKEPFREPDKNIEKPKKLIFKVDKKIEREQQKEEKEIEPPLPIKKTKIELERNIFDEI